MRPESTQAAGRRAATRADLPPPWCSGLPPPKKSLADGLKVRAAAPVARQRCRPDPRDLEPPPVLFDLLTDAGQVALALAKLVARRLRDEEQVAARAHRGQRS